MFCIECGTSNPDSAKFCNACGKSISPLSSPPDAGEAEVAVHEFPIQIQHERTASAVSLSAPEPPTHFFKYAVIVFAIICAFVIAAILSNDSSDSEQSRNVSTPSSPSPQPSSWLSKPLHSDDWDIYTIDPNITVWFDRHTSIDERKELFSRFVDQMTSPKLENYFASRFSAENERWQGKFDDSSTTYRIVFTKCDAKNCADFTQTEYLGKGEGAMPFEFQWRMDTDSRTIRPTSDAATDLEQYMAVYDLNRISEQEYLNFLQSVHRFH